MRPYKKMSQRRPSSRKPERKKREGDIRNNATDKAECKTIVLLQFDLMPPQPQVEMTRRRNITKMFPRLPVIMAIKSVTIPLIVPSQKN